MEIKINITGIEGLTESIALLASAIATDREASKLVTATEKVKEEAKKPAKEKKEEVKEPEKEESKEVPVTKKVEESFSDDPKVLTIENVRAAFMAKNSKANKPKLKAIIEGFGVSKLTDIPEKDFPKALEELEAL